jgi:hypothetical protein
MISRIRVILVTGLATLASLLALGVGFRHGIPTADEAQSKISAPVAQSPASQSADSASPVDYLAPTAAEATASTLTGAEQSFEANQTSSYVGRPDNVTRSKPNSRHADLQAEDDIDVDVFQHRIPFVLLDLTGVLPATPEVAATVQKLRQDFIDSTGAATANPADPNFAALWDQVQPTADEEFCAIFGTEACSALSIAERRELGHF